MTPSILAVLNRAEIQHHNKLQKRNGTQTHHAIQYYIWAKTAGRKTKGKSRKALQDAGIDSAGIFADKTRPSKPILSIWCRAGNLLYQAPSMLLGTPDLETPSLPHRLPRHNGHLPPQMEKAAQNIHKTNPLPPPNSTKNFFKVKHDRCVKGRGVGFGVLWERKLCYKLPFLPAGGGIYEPAEHDQSSGSMACSLDRAKLTWWHLQAFETPHSTRQDISNSYTH